MNKDERQKLLKSFLEPDDKLFFGKVIDQACLSSRTKENTFSDFMDPFRAEKMMELLSDKFKDLDICTFGGYFESERRMIGFFPKTAKRCFYEDYNTLENYCLKDSEIYKNIETFPISMLEVSFNSNFAKNISHRDFLGSVLGLGIERECIGDILIFEKKAVFFVFKDLAGFIEMSFDKVARLSVKTKEIFEFDENEIRGSFTDVTKTVAALRIDCVVAAGFNISRSQATEYIKSDKVFVNWILCSNPAKPVPEESFVTLRGFGRFKFLKVMGTTKKDRFSCLFRI